MEISNGSTEGFSSHTKKVKHLMNESEYSSMEEDNDVKVIEVGKCGERSDEEWIKPKIERKSSAESSDNKNRLAVITAQSPSRQHLSDGAASSSEMSPGATSPSRSCTQCGATKTPLWRNGPCGPKSLCNACGIRYKKVGSTKRGSSSVASTTDPHDSHQSGKSSSKSPKRKAETAADGATDHRSHNHRRSRLVVRDKEKHEIVEEHKVVAAAASAPAAAAAAAAAPTTASCSNVVFRQQCPRVTVPRRVCTRRSLPAFHTPKWGNRSARFNTTTTTFRKSQTKDEEEGAALLMALACGLVNA